MPTFGAEGRDRLESPPDSAAGPRRVVLAAGGALGLALLVVGAVLWSLRGQAVFVDLLSSALALCF
ncbi:MAG: hypothetical protein U1E62_14155 [Alsobacter sp.]